VHFELGRSRNTWILHDALIRHGWTTDFCPLINTMFRMRSAKRSCRRYLPRRIYMAPADAPQHPSYRMGHIQNTDHASKPVGYLVERRLTLIPYLRLPTSVLHRVKFSPKRDEFSSWSWSSSPPFPRLSSPLKELPLYAASVVVVARPAARA